MIARLSIGLLVVLGACAPTPATVPPAETEPETAAPREEPARTEPDETTAIPPPTEPEPQPSSPPTLCAQMCIMSRQMQAESIESISAKCVSECTAQATEPADPACVAKAKAASARASKGGTSKRAPKVWKEIGTDLACGHVDDVLDRLAKAGVTAKVAEREAAFAEVLASDPYFSRLCPAGIEVLTEVAAQPAAERSAWLVQRCPLPDVDPEGATRDLPPATLLAIETLALRWQAYGARSEHHQRLLDTLRLASALEADASGGP